MVFFLVCMILCSKFDRQHFTRQTIRYGDISFSTEYCINHHNCRSRSIKQSKVCNATSKTYYVIFTFTWCCVSTKYSIQYFDKLLTVLGNSSPSPNIEENTTTVVPVWLLKHTTTHSQNIVSSLFIQLILYTSYYWVTYLIPNPHSPPSNTPKTTCSFVRKYMWSLIV